MVQLAARGVELGAVGRAAGGHVVAQDVGGALDEGDVLEGEGVVEDGDGSSRDCELVELRIRR
jgi:hypothetical protein